MQAQNLPQRALSSRPTVIEWHRLFPDGPNQPVLRLPRGLILRPRTRPHGEVQPPAEVSVWDRGGRIGEALGRRGGRDNAAAGFENEDDSGADVLRCLRVSVVCVYFVCTRGDHAPIPSNWESTRITWIRARSAVFNSDHDRREQRPPQTHPPSQKMSAAPVATY